MNGLIAEGAKYQYYSSCRKIRIKMKRQGSVIGAKMARLDHQPQYLITFGTCNLSAIFDEGVVDSSLGLSAYA
jgi:hypothetical protein